MDSPEPQPQGGDAETSGQKQARLRRERREAKIKEGGSARLDKITNLSGRQNLPGMLSLAHFSTQMLTLRQSSHLRLLPQTPTMTLTKSTSPPIPPLPVPQTQTQMVMMEPPHKRTSVPFYARNSSPAMTLGHNSKAKKIP